MIDLQPTRVNELFALGASLRTAQEVLPHTAGRFPGRDPQGLRLPLADEPHLEAWRAYLAAAADEGAWAALRRRLVQLSFPVRTGISATAAYQRAARQGDRSALAPGAPGLDLRAPEGVGLAIRPTAAGALPVITCAAREDFVALVRALAHRNEPVDVPEAMGALLVVGYTNWDRVAGLREAWATTARDRSDAAWAEEVRTQIQPFPQLYRDTFAICSSGPYSGVTAEAMGLGAAEWRICSQAIRVGHECAHYAVQRLLGAPQSSLLDEIVADFCGVIAAGRPFTADWFLRFMGLEHAPAYRPGGRLETYLGGAQLSPEATGLLGLLLKGAAENLERFSAAYPWPADPGLDLARLTVVLMGLSLEELAADDAPDRIGWALGGR